MRHQQLDCKKWKASILDFVFRYIDVHDKLEIKSNVLPAQHGVRKNLS